MHGCAPTPVRLSTPPAAFLTVADEAYGRAIPSEFLNRIQQEFSTKYEDKAGSVIKEGGLNSSLG